MNRRTIRSIATLGAPLLAGNLATYLMKAIDLAMLGRLGTEALAAAGIATLSTSVLYTFMWPVSLGVQALASRRYGRQNATPPSAPPDEQEQRRRETAWVLSNGAIAGWISISIALVLSTLIEPILSALLGNPTIVSLAMEYVRILRWSIVLLSLGMAHRGFFAAINKTWIVMVATVVGNVLNVLLNYTFIFGNFGAPRLGIGGAALGTLLSEAVITALFVAYGQLSPVMRPYRLLRFAHVRGATIRDIITVMVPPAVQNIAALSIFLTYQTLVGRLGTEYLAVTSLVFAMFRINKTLVGGFAQGASILVGNHLGVGDRDGAREVILSQQVIAGVIGVAIVVFVASVPQAILGLFSLESALVPIGVNALRFFVAFFFVEVLGYSFEIIFSHNGWGRLVLVSEFTTNVTFILGFTVLAVWVFGWGIYGAWSGFAVYQLAHALILFGGFLSGRWMTVDVERRASPAVVPPIPQAQPASLGGSPPPSPDK